MAEDLTDADRRVGAALIQHFNPKTLRCDPSTKRLALLAHMSERTLFRSLNRLCEKGFFRRISHGGPNLRNSYEPMWDFFRRREAAINSRFKNLRHSYVSSVSGSTGQMCQVATDSGVTQTYSNQLIPLTCSAKTNASRLMQTPIPAVKIAPQRPLQSPFGQVALQGRNYSEAARDLAEARWNQALTQLLVGNPDAFSGVLEAINDDVRAATTEAELKRNGAGLQYLIKTLGHVLPSWTGGT